jgi:hypothetical protein
MWKNASSKQLIKYENANSEDVWRFVPPNYAWLAQNKLKISSYYGNDLHLASNLTYRNRFPWYGRLDRDWLAKSGCDYLILTPAGKQMYQDLIDEAISFPLPDGSVVYKTLFGRGLDAFDNGIVRIPGFHEVKEFKTDFRTKSTVTVASNTPIDVYYELFPEDSLRVKVDGKKIKYELREGQVVVPVSAGNHEVMFYYSNPLLSIFNVLYGTYLFAVVSIAISFLLPLLGLRKRSPSVC